VTLPEYWKNIARSDGGSWSKNTAERYSMVYFPKVKPVANKQGFTCVD